MKIKVFLLITILVLPTVFPLKSDSITDCYLHKLSNIHYITFICSDDIPLVNFFDDSTNGTCAANPIPKQFNKDTIENIRFRNCALASLPNNLFENFENIRTLNITSIGLESLDIEDLKNADHLQKLIASQNELSEIPSLVFAIEIQWANFSLNKIISIDPLTFSHSFKLEILDLSRNAIEMLKKGVFDKLRRLEFLYLSQNKISHIDSDIFADLVNLFLLDLSDNNIKMLNARTFINLHSLDTAILSNNQINQIESFAFSGASHLTTLDLANNNISRLNRNILQHLSSLQYLNLSNVNLG